MVGPLPAKVKGSRSYVGQFGAWDLHWGVGCKV